MTVTRTKNLTPTPASKSENHASTSNRMMNSKKVKWEKTDYYQKILGINSIIG